MCCRIQNKTYGPNLRRTITVLALFASGMLLEEAFDIDGDKAHLNNLWMEAAVVVQAVLAALILHLAVSVHAGRHTGR